MFETTIRDEVLQAAATGARWLSTGWDGGYHRADGAYNISVPTGWDRRDLSAYIDERLAGAGFDIEGPALLTGVDLAHAVGAHTASVSAIATVGLSNPAALPMEPAGESTGVADPADSTSEPGTVNLIVGTGRALDDGGLATLLGVVVEAKAATLQQLTGFTGTTSDAVIVASDPDGDPSTFAGSATPVGDAARAAVRDAIREGIARRYDDSGNTIPESVASADSGIETNRRATLFDP